MTDPTLPPPDPDPEAALHVDAPPRRGLDPVPVLFGFGFLVLAGAIGFLYTHPYHRTRGGPAADRLDVLERRVTALEHRPAPVLTGSPDSPDLRALQQRLAALENRATSAPDQTGSAELAQQMQSEQAAIAARLAELDKQVQAARDAAEQLHVGAMWQHAAAELAMGRPLGPLPGAPPALQRFAIEPPPTEAALRKDFPKAAAAARAASRPDAGRTALWNRLWAQAQRAVVIRRGDTVVVGDPAAGPLADADAQLDQGDLAGAVATLHGLQGRPAQAMAPWLDRAQALLAARQAFADHTD